ncbi:CRISPR-associated protein [Actinobacillus equuli]|nr:CRISPR-associated protein [Actinobacillus equuli]
MVGFCSGGGTPLFNGTETEIGCDFLALKVNIVRSNIYSNGVAFGLTITSG